MDQTTNEKTIKCNCGSYLNKHNRARRRQSTRRIWQAS